MKDHLHRDCNISSHVSCSKTWIPQTIWTHAWTRSTQKLTVASGPSLGDCSILQMGPFAEFLSKPRPRLWKKKKKEKKTPNVSRRPDLRLWSKAMASHSAQMHPENQAPCTQPRVGTGTPRAVRDGLPEIWLSHLLQLSLVSSVHSWHCLKLVSVLQKLQNQTWEEQGSKDQPKRGSAERQSLPVHPFKGLYHWDCLTSQTKLIYFLVSSH